MPCWTTRPSRNARRIGCAASAALLVWLAPGDSGHAQTLATVFLRTQQYLSRYQATFSAVVSKETYHQEIRRKDEVHRKRDLLSDVLMVWVPADESWLIFRDVYEVNGREVRDRQRRLERLFIESPQTAFDQAKQIAEESARFNIGDVSRNVNLPTMALGFLYPANMPRSNFSKRGEETLDGTATWIVEFVEHARPTVIRSAKADIFSRGRFWIDPVEGRVLRSRLEVGDVNTDVRASIAVSYEPNAELGFWVPSRMEEEYSKRRGRPDEKIHGLAAYSDFRTFQVQVDEAVRQPSEGDAEGVPPDPPSPVTEGTAPR